MNIDLYNDYEPVMISEYFNYNHQWSSICQRYRGAQWIAVADPEICLARFPRIQGELEFPNSKFYQNALCLKIFFGGWGVGIRKPLPTSDPPVPAELDMLVEIPLISRSIVSEMYIYTKFRRTLEKQPSVGGKARDCTIESNSELPLFISPGVSHLMIFTNQCPCRCPI